MSSLVPDPEISLFDIPPGSPSVVDMLATQMPRSELAFDDTQPQPNTLTQRFREPAKTSQLHSESHVSSDPFLVPTEEPQQPHSSHDNEDLSLENEHNHPESFSLLPRRTEHSQAPKQREAYPMSSGETEHSVAAEDQQPCLSNETDQIDQDMSRRSEGQPEDDEVEVDFEEAQRPPAPPVASGSTAASTGSVKRKNITIASSGSTTDVSTGKLRDFADLINQAKVSTTTSSPQRQYQVSEPDEDDSEDEPPMHISRFEEDDELASCLASTKASDPKKKERQYGAPIIPQTDVGVKPQDAETEPIIEQAVQPSDQSPDAISHPTMTSTPPTRSAVNQPRPNDRQEIVPLACLISQTKQTEGTAEVTTAASPTLPSMDSHLSPQQAGCNIVYDSDGCTNSSIEVSMAPGLICETDLLPGNITHNQSDNLQSYQTKELEISQGRKEPHRSEQVQRGSIPSRKRSREQSHDITEVFPICSFIYQSVADQN